MNCLEFEANLPLFLYAELSAEERMACEAHLEACANCRTTLEKTEQLHRALGERPRQELTAALLAESRQALDEALECEQHGWHALVHHGLPILRLQPASVFAVGLTMVLCGFGLGWGLRPHAGRLTANPAGVNTATLAHPDLENMRIRGISRVAPDPETGGVRITMDAERRVTLDGSLDDPQIQQVLVYAMKRYDNPGIRRDTLDALRSHTNNPNIRGALLYALQHDSNAGVRLEALEAVRSLECSNDVHRTMLEALQHDTNPGVRVAALDALIDHEEAEGRDPTIQKVLDRLATTDRNSSIRVKCREAVMKFGK
jgi:Putative zinc-finger